MYFELENKKERSITQVIIIINIIIFLIELVAYEEMIIYLSLIPALLFQGVQLWRLITHMFLHASFLHILLNMYALYIFGIDVEKFLGRDYYLLLYFGSGITGALLFSAMAVFVYNTPYVYSLGASAAVFGVMAAYAFLFPNRRLTIFMFPIVFRMKAKHFAIIYALIELFRAIFLGPSGQVAYAAHVGGFLFGFLFIMYMKNRVSLYGERYVTVPVVYY